MKLQLQCLETGQPCWNAEILGEYSRQVSDQEAAYANKHPQLVVGIGRIVCDGPYRNIYGGGELCDVRIT